jgi:hypothetical protein
VSAGNSCESGEAEEHAQAAPWRAAALAPDQHRLQGLLAAVLASRADGGTDPKLLLEPSLESELTRVGSGADVPFW